MFSAQPGHRRKRRGRIAVSVAALAASAASVFLMMPAHAGTTSDTQSSDAAQLRAKVQQVKAHTALKGADTASATATPTSTKGSSTAKPHIIGGTATAISSAPWMVQLWYDNGDGTGTFCGGTLVAPNKVLTAGHCVSGANWPANGIVVGGTATLGGTDTSPVSAVRAQWLHSGFNETTIDNDIALLTLSTPFTSTKTLPLATNTDTALYAGGTQATVYGWGVTDSEPGSQNLAETLQRLQLPLNSDGTCKDELDGAIGDGAYITGHMVCGGVGGTGDDTTGKTTCSGDSGGPLVVSGKIVGVVSWGVSDDTQDCNVLGTYDVFTKVAAFGGAVQPRINDTDVSRDAKADLVVKTSAGASYAYSSTGANFKSRVNAPISFKNYNTVVQADVERDGYQDFILKASGSGNVFLGHRTPTRASYSYVQIGTNWSTRRAILVPGDLTGDGIPDLLSETSDGKVWIYSGKGNGLFNTPVAAGTGWNKYNLIVGHGDFSNDGKADVFARDAKTGNLYLLQGTGNAATPFLAPVLVRNAWTGYNSLVAVGDVSGDGRADLLARSASGVLYLYKGTGKITTDTFAAAVTIGAGWNQYSVLG